jgi:hypothetical protein
MHEIVSLDSYRLGASEELAEANHRIANHLAMVVGLIQSQIADVLRGQPLVARAKTSDACCVKPPARSSPWRSCTAAFRSPAGTARSTRPTS